MPFDPRTAYPQPPFAQPKASMPGQVRGMDPKPDHGKESCKGSGRLAGKAALAFAREGAGVALPCLDQREDAKKAASWVEKAGRRTVLAPGDVSGKEHCKALVARTAEEFGKIDALVNNAACQVSRPLIGETGAEEWDHAFRTNLYAYSVDHAGRDRGEFGQDDAHGTAGAARRAGAILRDAGVGRVELHPGDRGQADALTGGARVRALMGTAGQGGGSCPEFLE